MKYTLDNLDFPIVAIGTQIIDGEVSFENHTILFKSRNHFNEFLGETEEITSELFGEDMKKVVNSFENGVELFYGVDSKTYYEKWHIYSITSQH